MEKTCKSCLEIKPKVYNDLCRPCFQRVRAKTLPMANCHPDRRSVAGGLCKSCYRSGLRAPKAVCHPDRPNAARGLCNSCYNELPENKERDRVKRRARKYGLSSKEFLEMFDRQNGLCLICKEKEFTAVDHDHSTGKVRGLLCGQCNTGLGMFKDNMDYLKQAIIYLENNNALR